MGVDFSPLDAELGLAPAQRYTPRVEEALVQLAVETTFGRAVKLLGRLTGVVSSTATARRRTYAAGTAALAVEAAACRAVEAMPPAVIPSAAVLQVSLDATTVQLVGGEWSEVKLASVAQVVEGRDREGQPVAKAVDLSYAVRWASAEQFAASASNSNSSASILATPEAGDHMMLRGSPPVGTCTICVGKRDVGWQSHFGVVRALDNLNFYRGQ